MRIRSLSTLAECRQAAALEQAIWGYADADEIVPPSILIVAVKRGGILLGAFGDGGRMDGYAYAVPSLRDGRRAIWSHALGVVPEARGRGVATALKIVQRQQAQRMGIDLIEWSCDPLQTAPAHLNFARLGVVVEEYEENLYGESSSVLHAGVPTDRFIAQWNLNTPHVERRLAAAEGIAAPGRRRAAQPIGVRDSAVVSAVLVNEARAAGEWLAPRDGTLDVEGSRVLVEIPSNFTEMLTREPALALEWRLSTRAIFQAYFTRGYRVVDFFLARERGRGQYLLARAAS